MIISLTKKGEELQNDAKNIPKLIGNCLNLNKEESITLYLLLYKVLINIEKEIIND